MAINDEKKNIKLGNTKAENLKNIDDNFTSLFDTADDLNTAIGTKETVFTKNSAFNKSFETVAGNIKMNGSAAVGMSNNIARADHVHPTDTSRQSAAPDGTNPLLKDGKINVAYLPDTITGQLYYMGTWNPNTITIAVTAKRGDYYIASATGWKNPSNIQELNDPYETGDWAVYNGTSWDKIDNTDAVRLVNGQKGNVQTYKGEFKKANSYHNGDIVLYEGSLYLCIFSNLNMGVTDSIPTDTEYWQIFGKIYSTATTSADGLMSKADKAKLDGIAASANNYIHPTSAGNKHVPAGGASGQILRWSADGIAVWGADNDTKYIAGEGVTISPSNVIQANLATPNEIGGFRTGYYNNGKNYAVLVDAATKKAYVNVPWTSYECATQQISGLMSSTDKKKLDGMTATFDETYLSMLIDAYTEHVRFGVKVFSANEFSNAGADGWAYDFECDMLKHFILRVYKDITAHERREVDVQIVRLEDKYVILSDEAFDGALEFMCKKAYCAVHSFGGENNH